MKALTQLFLCVQQIAFEMGEAYTFGKLNQINFDFSKLKSSLRNKPQPWHFLMKNSSQREVKPVAENWPI